MSEVLSTIRSKGHWIIQVKPERPGENVSFALLDKAIRDSKVSMRGWDFPHYDMNKPPSRELGYIEQELKWSRHIYLWRAYRSGQFVMLDALGEDWSNDPVATESGDGPRSDRRLSVESAVFRFMEIYQFAVRWFDALNLGGNVVIMWELRNIKDRVLTLSPSRSPFFSLKQCSTERWKLSEPLGRSELWADTKTPAARAAAHLFSAFSWDVDVGRIRTLQAELLR